MSFLSAGLRRMALSVTLVLLLVCGAYSEDDAFEYESPHPWIMRCAIAGIPDPMSLPREGSFADSLLMCLVDQMATFQSSDDEAHANKWDDGLCFPPTLLAKLTSCDSKTFEAFFRRCTGVDLPHTPLASNFRPGFFRDPDPNTIFLGSLSDTMCSLFDGLKAQKGRDCLSEVCASSFPSSTPSLPPSDHPSVPPSASPTHIPSAPPSDVPTPIPSSPPSTIPSDQPSFLPSAMPSLGPSAIPSDEPSLTPSTVPSDQPSLIPSDEPSLVPSSKPSREPSVLPSSEPSPVPSTQPSWEPTLPPSPIPSNTPSPNEVPSETSTYPPTKVLPIVQVDMLTRLILDGVPSISLPPSRSFLQALTMAFEAILSPVDGHSSVDVVSVNDSQRALRHLEDEDSPLHLVVRIVARRQCLEKDCSEPTAISEPIVKEYRQTMEEAVNSGALADEILYQARVYNAPSLFAVLTRPASSEIISYSVAVLADGTNDHSAAFSWNLSLLSASAKLIIFVWMAIS